MVSADRVRLRARAARGDRGAKTALSLLANPPRLLTTTLLGVNIVSVALTTVGTVLMVSLFGGYGELAALLIFTPLFLVLGEIVPKSVYQQKADTLVPHIAWPLSWLQALLAPLIWLFGGLAGLVARLVGSASDEARAAQEQFVATVQMAEQTGAAAAFSRGQVRRVLRFSQMTAAEIMWPISRVRCLNREGEIGALLALRREHDQRLVPLYEGTRGNVTAIAVVESWDLLDPAIDSRALEDFLRPVRFVPFVQNVREIGEMLLDDPTATIVVVNEAGEAVGLITLNQIVRRTLGAHTSAVTDRATDERSARPAARPDGSVLLDAGLPIVSVNEALGTALPTLNHSALGGYALSRFGRLPAVGDSFEEEGFRFSAAEVTERRIVSLEARRID